MFEVFGELTAEEINKTAEGLKNEGDINNLIVLAKENGIDEMYARLYIEDELNQLCDVASAALGKLAIEEADLKPVEIIEDWVAYIKGSCLDDENIAVAVRKKGKNLKGCIAELLKWSFKNAYNVDKDIIKAAGVSNATVKMGIPGIGTAKKLIKEYYLG
ncbi:MAG: hypothetical protein U0L56_03420 [Lachnospiraceae bacterium]|nr:hypothetical protein [Lachnospiraceae bacterium]